MIPPPKIEYVGQQYCFVCLMTIFSFFSTCIVQSVLRSFQKKTLWAVSVRKSEFNAFSTFLQPSLFLLKPGLFLAQLTWLLLRFILLNSTENPFPSENANNAPATQLPSVFFVSANAFAGQIPLRVSCFMFPDFAA